MITTGGLLSVRDSGNGMKTVIAIRSGISDLSGLRKPADLFTGEEIDRLDPAAFAGMNRPELHALKRKLSDSFDWLESGNWDLGDPRWKEWENRLDRLNELMAYVDEYLYSAEARYDVI